MGGGSWTTSSFTSYINTTRANTASVSLDGTVDYMCLNSVQDVFVSRSIDAALNPKGVIRECCDSEEHPCTVPVILALDVTGSMGSTAMEVAKKINVVMTKLYDEVKDVEFMVMGIGDLSYDRAPIQASQFESDIRIAEQLDKVFFEGGGGGNDFESYTAAWYFGSRHTKLDCWNRGKKGIIITMGDEPLNPYLPHKALSAVCGDNLQGDIETSDLYKEVIEKFDVYHLNVKHGYDHYGSKIKSTFCKYLDEKHFKDVTLNSIANEIVDIVVNASNGNNTQSVTNSNGEISW